ncbi:hypothetical protein [Eggerthella sp. HGA1]|uniref:hypothetical protein n=1 Tax=Eggerthella sp. HGA1 TaxID=910311 RepID=UPI0001FD70A5|nr:hypothetical protein [Eggerthella sp. HGA1]EGC88161.1 hypothetical protein HMPREF9404_3990 [Eggerthella sp. HGA1]
MNEENAKTEKLENRDDEKVDGLAEPLEDGQAAGLEQGEPTEEEGAPKRKRRIVAAAVLGAAVIVLCVAGIVSAAMPSEVQKPEKAQTVEKQADDSEADLKPSLAINLEAEGWDGSATPAKILLEASTPNGEAEPIEVDVACNEDVVLVEADEFLRDVEYKVSVVRAPVLADGSTYVAEHDRIGLELSTRGISKEDASSKAYIELRVDDGEPVNVGGMEAIASSHVVHYKGTDVTLSTKDMSDGTTMMAINLTLAPKELADMSAEEVEASASALEAAGKSDAAQAVVQSAPATSGNAAQGGGAGSGSTSGGGSSEPAPIPTPTPSPDPAPTPDPAPEPEPPAHVHTWIAETTTQTIYHNFCGICNDDIQGIESSHLKAHALAGEGVGNAYSAPAGTETVNTGRYYCSCGAWK